MFKLLLFKSITPTFCMVLIVVNVTLTTLKDLHLTLRVFIVGMIQSASLTYRVVGHYL